MGVVSVKKYGSQELYKIIGIRKFVDEIDGTEDYLLFLRNCKTYNESRISANYTYYEGETKVGDYLTRQKVTQGFGAYGTKLGVGAYVTADDIEYVNITSLERVKAEKRKNNPYTLSEDTKDLFKLIGVFLFLLFFGMCTS